MSHSCPKHLQQAPLLPSCTGDWCTEQSFPESRLVKCSVFMGRCREVFSLWAVQTLSGLHALGHEDFTWLFRIRPVQCSSQCFCRTFTFPDERYQLIHTIATPGNFIRSFVVFSSLAKAPHPGGTFSNRGAPPSHLPSEGKGNLQSPGWDGRWKEAST